MEEEQKEECEHIEYQLIGLINSANGNTLNIYEKRQCIKCNAIFRGDLIESIMK